MKLKIKTLPLINVMSMLVFFAFVLFDAYHETHYHGITVFNESENSKSTKTIIDGRHYGDILDLSVDIYSEETVARAYLTTYEFTRSKTNKEYILKRISKNNGSRSFASLQFYRAFENCFVVLPRGLKSLKYMRFACED